MKAQLSIRVKVITVQRSPPAKMCSVSISMLSNSSVTHCTVWTRCTIFK